MRGWQSRQLETGNRPGPDLSCRPHDAEHHHDSGRRGCLSVGEFDQHGCPGPQGPSRRGLVLASTLKQATAQARRSTREEAVNRHWQSPIAGERPGPSGRHVRDLEITSSSEPRTWRLLATRGRSSRRGVPGEQGRDSGAHHHADRATSQALP